MIVIVILRIAFVVVLVDVVVIVEELAFGIGHRNRERERENVMGYQMTVSEGLTKKTSLVATSQGVEGVMVAIRDACVPTQRRRGKHMGAGACRKGDSEEMQRFIPSQGDVSLYVLGEEIFSCLVRRSFFQDVFEKDIDTGDICKMHDLMHDLAQYEMRHDCAVIGPGKKLITPDE
nr:disease resistance protein [Tanacetum cinerariifolium]